MNQCTADNNTTFTGNAPYHIPWGIELPDSYDVLTNARIPEHSVFFMRAMSCGEPFLADSHLFIAGEDWLIGIGYPLEGNHAPGRFEKALRNALKRVRPEHCWAAAPTLPPSLADHCVEKDRYYILQTAAGLPSRPLALASRAEGTLQVAWGRVFTPAHAHLWAEFTGSRDLPDRVRSLYERTPRVLAAVDNLHLLNAWDENGNLAACLLLDSAPARFVSYIIGAHSRMHYTPYATDLLFREMIFSARKQGKKEIHLGLGVNEGIRRFKVKWGGLPEMNYELAAWKERRFYPMQSSRTLPSTQAFYAPVFSEGQDKWKFIQSLPPQRKLAMLWQVEKNGRRSWIAGASHFCRYSFSGHLRKVFAEVDAVLCEGPLDRVSMEMVADIGRTPDSDSLRMDVLLGGEEIDRLEKVVCGPRGMWAKLLNTVYADAPDVRHYLAETRHWMAFYGLWSAFLRRHGWNQSVDMEAWHLAMDMGKYVLGMETIAEQIRTLESIPADRIVRFFQSCDQWPRMMKANERGYITGNLRKMFGTSTEFPSRTEQVIEKRDKRFLKRMLPFMEEGGCAVFVGTAHMLNLPGLLREAGFTVRGPGT